MRCSIFYEFLRFLLVILNVVHTKYIYVLFNEKCDGSKALSSITIHVISKQKQDVSKHPTILREEVQWNLTPLLYLVQGLISP